MVKNQFWRGNFNFNDNSLLFLQVCNVIIFTFFTAKERVFMMDIVNSYNGIIIYLFSTIPANFLKERNNILKI